MVHLLRSTRSATAEDGKEITLPTIRAVAVQFLSHGRNAWHATWIRRYNVGDFFRDGRRVKAVVERRKTRGTVFYMKVLPAFQIGYGDRKFLLTEINTGKPFQHVDLLHGRYGLIGQSLTGFLENVSPPSPLWKVGQQTRNHIILQEVAEDFIDLTSYTMLARGSDAHNNPPIGSYARQIVGSFAGESEWLWSPIGDGAKVSLRWYNKLLEAMMESRERLAAHQRP